MARFSFLPLWLAGFACLLCLTGCPKQEPYITVSNFWGNWKDLPDYVGPWRDSAQVEFLFDNQPVRVLVSSRRSDPVYQKAKPTRRWGAGRYDVVFERAWSQMKGGPVEEPGIFLEFRSSSNFLNTRFGALSFEIHLDSLVRAERALPDGRQGRIVTYQNRREEQGHPSLRQLEMSQERGLELLILRYPDNRTITLQQP